MNFNRFFILHLTFLLLFSSVAFSAERVALVIGNGDYKSSPLRNAINDAKDMSKKLQALGFEVIHKSNADKPTVLKAINQFGRKLRSSEVGLFYYAGHGLQVKGSNYLIPIGAYVSSETDVEYEGVNAGRILGKMETAGNKVNIIILDACRDNPFKRSFRSSTRGLARMDAPRGTFIAYSTKPGSVAADGDGRNGIFTKHLLKNMTTPDLPIEKVLKRVRNGVLNDTAQQQMPWQSSSLTGEFYFASSGAVIDGASINPSKASLSVKSNLADATITVDGRYMGKTDTANINVSPGTHRVRVEKDGYEPYSRSVNINSGRSLSLFVDLSRRAPSKARLYVDTSPSDATVRILNIVPQYFRGIDLAAGSYTLEVSADGFNTRTLKIELSSGEDKYLDIQLSQISTSIPQATETSQDGRFISYNNGTVLDNKYELMWAAKDNGQDINFYDANQYCNNYQGGGYKDWRMPTGSELRYLYNKDNQYPVAEKKYDVHLTSLIELSAGTIWSSSKWLTHRYPFNFIHGSTMKTNIMKSNGIRVLPVRSAE